VALADSPAIAAVTLLVEGIPAVNVTSNETLKSPFSSGATLVTWVPAYVIITDLLPAANPAPVTSTSLPQVLLLVLKVIVRAEIVRLVVPVLPPESMTLICCVPDDSVAELTGNATDTIKFPLLSKLMG